MLEEYDIVVFPFAAVSRIEKSLAVRRGGKLPEHIVGVGEGPMDEQQRPAAKSPGDIGRIKNKFVVGLPSQRPQSRTQRSRDRWVEVLVDGADSRGHLVRG